MDRVVAGGMTHLRDYPVKCRSLVTKAVLARGKLAEVLGSLRNSFVIEFEDDPSSRL